MYKPIVFQTPEIERGRHFVEEIPRIGPEIRGLIGGALFNKASPQYSYCEEGKKIDTSRLTWICKRGKVILQVIYIHASLAKHSWVVLFFHKSRDGVLVRPQTFIHSQAVIRLQIIKQRIQDTALLAVVRPRLAEPKGFKRLL